MMSTHIALIDDDEDDRLFFREALKTAKIEANLTEFVNGETFVKELENPNAPVPELVFLDINMPRIDGYQILKAIRQYSHYAKTKIIMFSTSDENVNLDKAMAHNASGFATKPTDYKVLEQTIKDVVAHFAVPHNQHLFYTIVNAEK